jgi:hypothetical protein
MRSRQTDGFQWRAAAIQNPISDPLKNNSAGFSLPRSTFYFSLPKPILHSHRYDGF